MSRLLVASLCWLLAGCAGAPPPSAAARAAAVTVGPHAAPPPAPSSLPTAAPTARIEVAFAHDPEGERALSSPESGEVLSSPLDVLRPPERSLSGSPAGLSISGWQALGTAGGDGEPKVGAPVDPEVEAKVAASHERFDRERLAGDIEERCVSQEEPGAGVFRAAIRVRSGYVSEVRTLENAAPRGFASCVEPIVFRATLLGLRDATRVITVTLRPAGRP